MARYGRPTAAIVLGTSLWLGFCGWAPCPGIAQAEDGSAWPFRDSAVLADGASWSKAPPTAFIFHLEDEPAEACTTCPPNPCDCKKMAALKKAVASSHKPLFYDNLFDYLCDPCYDGCNLGDNLKRLDVGSHITLDAGGQYRYRGMFERDIRNFRGVLGPTAVDDNFLLHRTRLYLNAEIGDSLRAYAEYIDAESNYEDFGPRPIEVNRSDMLNLFGDVKLLDSDLGRAWARAGRQELLYGSQRAVSPLDWANTRRTFEGYKAFWRGDKWSVDAFYTRPVYPHPVKFDSPDYDQEFMGFWGSYSSAEQKTLDLYYLAFNNGDVGFKYDTLGGRLLGGQDDWLWEIEGGVQFGQNQDSSDHSAGFWVAGLGRKFTDVCGQPALWVYYDWASGSNDRGASHGYHHMFPLAHKYLGFMDLYGRQNIETPNVLLTLSPHEKIQFLVWYYYFFLQNENDTPYSVVMTPYNRDNAPASADLGHELDLTMTYKVNARMGLLLGYSHFFAGDYYKLTPGVPHRGDADFFYTEMHVDF